MIARLLLLVACSAGFSLPCAAQLLWHTQNGPELVLSTARLVELRHRSGSNAIDGLMRSINAAPGGGGAVAVVDRVKGPGPLGPVIDVDVRRTIPWANVARGVARALPLISTAIAVAEIAEAIRCREAFGGGSECDAGRDEAEVETIGYRISFGGNTAVRTSRQAACDLAIPWIVASGVSVNNAQVEGSAPLYGCRYREGTVNKTYLPLNIETSTELKCPDVVVNGVTLTPVKGPDGKCATNVYEPASEDHVAGRAEAYGDRSKAPLIVSDLDAAGHPIPHPVPVSDPVPDAVYGPRETTQHPDGSTTTRDPAWDLAPTPNGYGWTPRTITKDWPPGVTPSPPGEVDGGTTTSGGSAPERDVITCGLPDTPACKIDETGTPSGSDLPSPESAVAGAKAGIMACISDPASCFPSLPALSWGFALPSSCGPVSIPAFAPWLTEVDICWLQPMFHDLMSVVWVLGGLFGAIGLFWRKAFSA